MWGDNAKKSLSIFKFLVRQLDSDSWFAAYTKQAFVIDA